MIHSGGAYGGHYYAYIKSFEDGKWYNFNDSTVTEIKDEEELFKTFGDTKGNCGTACPGAAVDGDAGCRSPAAMLQALLE